MTPRWFAPLGWTHRPATLAGWVITALAVMFLVTVFRAIDRNSHSASDTLIPLFPHLVATLAAWAWVARHTSGAGTHP